MVSVDQIRDVVGKVAPQYHIRSVKLFGSYAEGKASENSDIDLLVEYAENPVSLLKIYGFKEEVSEALEKDVDVLKYPLENLIFPDFKVNKAIEIYG